MLKSLWGEKLFKDHCNARFGHITGPQYFIILQVNYMIRFLYMQCAQVCIQLSVL